jgi:hypothetical protein
MALPRDADVGPYDHVGLAKSVFTGIHDTPKEKSGVKTLVIGGRPAGSGDCG